MKLFALACAAVALGLPSYALSVSSTPVVQGNLTDSLVVRSRAKTCEPPDDMPPIPANAPPNSTWMAKGKPIPARFRHGPVGFRIEFRSAEEIDRICADQPSGLPVCGAKFYACVRDKTMFMPNPCDTSIDDDAYVGTLCHEAAHGRGWPETHGD